MNTALTDQDKDFLNQVLNIFRDHGYQATTMQHITSTLGVNRTFIYKKYTGKRELFLAAFYQQLQAEIKWAGDFLYYQTNVRSGLYRLYEEIINSNFSKPNYLLILFNFKGKHSHSNELDFKVALKDHQQAWVGLYTTYLQYGMNQGQLAANSLLQELAGYLYTFQNGLLSRLASEKDAKVNMLQANFALYALV